MWGLWVFPGAGEGVSGILDAGWVAVESLCFVAVHRLADFQSEVARLSWGEVFRLR